MATDSPSASNAAPTSLASSQAQQGPEIPSEKKRKDHARQLFEHLGGILQLQSEIAAEHQALEKVTLNADRYFDFEKTETSNLPSHPTHARDSTGGTSAFRDHEAPQSGDMHANFAARQKGVSEVMSKLSELSQSLNSIHKLGCPPED